jgi:hypothetical protein
MRAGGGMNTVPGAPHGPDSKWDNGQGAFYARIEEWMRLRLFISASLIAAFFGAHLSFSQEPVQTPQTEAQVALPDAPLPQGEAAWQQQNPQQQTQNPPAQQPAQAPDSSSSSSQQQAPNAQQDKTQKEKADEQIREQEQQRTLGVVPAFNVTYRSDAVAMTAAQKMKLAFRSSIDPVTFAGAFLIAGYHEANDDYGGFGWGPEGYFKMSGAAYLDSFDGTMIGNGILPAVLHQDPRYFRLGYGSTMHRLLYAVATSYICKGDKSRKWQPNISNVGGNIISGAISNLYYPSSNSGWGQTIGDGMITTTEGSIGAVFNEFWPDISRKFLHKDPTHGLDAQARAAYEQQKLEKKQEKQDQKQQK